MDLLFAFSTLPGDDLLVDAVGIDMLGYNHQL